MEVDVSWLFPKFNYIASVVSFMHSSSAGYLENVNCHLRLISFYVQ